jgi:hypothetical protein
MDVQKFMFALSEANPSVLNMHAANLLMDIKNCCFSIVAYSSEMACCISCLSIDENKRKVDECMTAISSLSETYKLLAAQRKAILVRLQEIKKRSYIPQS